MTGRLAPIGKEDHVRGNADAELTLLEYGDFQCPHCRMAHTVISRLERHFGAKMRFVYRHFPLTEIHAMAEPAAEAAEFAATEGKFWEMHDAIFAGQPGLDEGMLVRTAGELHLDQIAVRAAIEQQRFAKRIERDITSGEGSGVHATPTFFINGKKYAGPWEYEELKDALDAA